MAEGKELSEMGAEVSRSLQQLLLEQETNLLASIQDLLKEQEKRLADRLLAELPLQPKAIPAKSTSVTVELPQLPNVPDEPIVLPEKQRQQSKDHSISDVQRDSLVGRQTTDSKLEATAAEKAEAKAEASRAEAARNRMTKSVTAHLQAEMQESSHQAFKKFGDPILDTDTKVEVLQKKARLFLETPTFGKVLALVILVNCFSLGWQVDWGVQNYMHEEPVVFEVFTVLFMIVFLLEFLLRCFAFGKYLFHCQNAELGWNIFDCVLVLSSIVDEIMSRASEGINVTALRVLRLARLLRILRVFRVVRYFTDLRVMVQGILLSSKTLIWALALLLILMFSVTVCILQLLRPHLRALESATEIADLNDSFGSLVIGIFTLFQAMSGGVDWGEVAIKLGKVSWVLAVLFCVYMAFALFCVLNVMTGVFVENASKMTSADEEMCMMEEVRARKEYVETVSRLFADCDKDNSGAVDWEEFQECAEDLRFQTCFKKLGIVLDTEADLRNVFQMLDFQNNGSVSVEEFAIGIQMFSGGAKSIDVARLMFEVATIKKYMTDMYGALVGPVAKEDKNSSMNFSVNAETAEVIEQAKAAQGQQRFSGIVPAVRLHSGHGTGS
ncbi:unnamed protein product [Effrenium voratum]|nr:unnamed protein product [Effrenium voratum]